MFVANIVGHISSKISKNELFKLVELEYPQASNDTWAIRLHCAVDLELQYIGNITPDEPFTIEGSCYVSSLCEVKKESDRLDSFLKRCNLDYEFFYSDGDQVEKEVYCSSKS